MRELLERLEVLRRPPVRLLLVAAVLLVIGDRAQHYIGGEGVGAGLSDELAHEMTGFLILAAFLRGASGWFTAGMLIGSVAIDADHIPQYLHDYFLTAGTQRPYTHSFLTCAVLLAISFLSRGRWRAFFMGLSLGVLVHLGRDLCESDAGVPLLWPWSYRSFHGSHPVYALIMCAISLIALARAMRADEDEGGRGEPYRDQAR